MSLYRRVLSAFMLIILLTVVISIGVGYWTTQRRLRQFSAEIDAIEANNLASYLSQAYTFQGGWESLDTTLFQSGFYIFDEVQLTESITPGVLNGEVQIIEPADIHALDEMVLTNSFEDAGRTVVMLVDETVLFDSFGELSAGDSAEHIDGSRASIIDLNSGETVGFVAVDWGLIFLEGESAEFLGDTLYTIVIGGLLTAGIALLIAVWFSRRITAPIIALTAATQSLAKRGETTLLPIRSNDELGQMSAAFNQMTTALQTQQTLRKRLISDVSHELNTPLSVIHLEANGLLDEMQPPEDAAKQIIQEVDMLRNLVHDLSWLAETDSGELRLKTESVSLDALLSAEISRWQTNAAARTIKLELRPLPQLPHMQLDPLRMSQALGNVLGNALQHTDEGGEVVVSAEITSESRVLISVQDSGVGVDSAELPLLFDRFYRTDASRNRRTGGSGLGLAITRAIIEAHGGTVSASSRGIGQGLTILFRLPLEPPSSAKHHNL